MKPIKSENGVFAAFEGELKEWVIYCAFDTNFEPITKLPSSFNGDELINFLNRMEKMYSIGYRRGYDNLKEFPAQDRRHDPSAEV